VDPDLGGPKTCGSGSATQLFSILVVIFALLDPDPQFECGSGSSNRINAVPCGSGSETLVQSQRTYQDSIWLLSWRSSGFRASVHGGECGAYTAPAPSCGQTSSCSQSRHPKEEIQLFTEFKS
jgi:hypothetical protein